MGLFSIRVSKKSTNLKEKGAQTWVKREVFDGRPYYFNTSRSAGLDDIVSLGKPEPLMDANEKVQRAGEWVWVPHPTEYWQVAKVLKRNKDGSVVVQPVKGQSFTIPKNGVVGPSRETGQRTQKVPLWPVNWVSMDWVEDDIIKLDGINEASILHNLRQRYMEDQIYTWIGANRSVLLSINPYTKLDKLYNDETMQLHKTMPHKPDQWVPPHVYTVANEAYDSLMNTDKDQSILVSGESGAGKTEATKYSLEFFADMVGSDSVEHHVSDKLILSNPLLEAFGNAVTLRNNNSSRFGKFIKVCFSRSTGKITGATFRNFMLEKTRVVSHQQGERSFHIFYMLLQDEEIREQLGLETVSTYAYLNQSKASLAPNTEDAPAFAKVKEAFSNLEFADDEVQSIYKIIAGILNAGNLTFKDKEQSSGVTGSEVVDDKWLESTADFWSVDVESLREMVTSRTVSARGETSAVVLDAAGAKDAVDALCKALYGKMFETLVRQVNESMAPPADEFFIGLLDIFGFEILETNSFEQLCINFCNEKLQQFHNQHTFDAEEKFYKSEKVEYHFLKPRDNQAVLDLIEKKPKGLLITLDDEGALPGGSDKGWLGKAEKEHETNELFGSDFRQKFESSLTFQITHYAGLVRYNATNFVAKNKDTMWASLYTLISSSSDALIQRMFPAGKYVSNTKPVAAQFRANVNDLLDLVKQTETRFIRCIKPNALMRPKDFDATLIVDQLNNSGVYETVEIRKTGFPFRLTHKQFAFQYGCVNIKHLYSKEFVEKGDWRNVCAEILNTNPQLQDLADDIRIGESMVLYRVSVHKPLTLLRNIAIELRLPAIQAFIRGSIGRHYMNQLRVAQSTLSDALETANDIDLVRKGFAQAEQVMEWLEPNLAFLPAYPMHLFEQGKHLESRLMAWEDLQAEMERNANGKTPEDVDVHLYKELIDLCKRADTELSDVKRTSAQEELYEFCQELIRESPPGQLDAEAGPALESLNRARMQAVKDKSDELGYPTETVDKIAFILDRLVFIDQESKDALDVLDGARMKVCLDEANLYRHTNESLKEIERLFAMPEEDFVKLELEAAKRLKDKTREIHRRIRLKEIFYDKEGGKFEGTWESGHAREPLQFAKAAGLKLCGRSAIAQGMQSWSDKPIPAPLSLMPGEIKGRDDTKEIKKYKKLCVKQFVNLQKFMGDKPVNEKRREKAGQDYIRFGWDHSNLRNELFLQTIKQLTNNPNEDSVKKGYEMLSLLMASFLPSDGFEDFLVMWVRRNAPAGDYRPYTSALHKLQFDQEASAKPRPIAELRKEFKQLSEDGSRFSIAIDAFTGPTNAVKPKPIPKSPLDRVKEAAGESPAEERAMSL